MRVKAPIGAALAACVIATGLSACGGSSDEPEFTIQVGHVLSEEEAIHQELVAVAERISEATDGKVELEIFANSQLGGNADGAEQAIAGAAVMAHIDPGYAAEYVPDMGVMSGPFLFQDTDEITALLGSDIFQKWSGELEAEGLVSLAWNWYFGERHVFGNQGYAAPSDLSGTIIRVPPNPITTQTFSTLPSSPSQLEWAEVYGALQQGVIDAAEAPLSTIKASSMTEVASTVTLTAHTRATTAFVVGADYWQTLPEDLRKIVVEEFQSGGENVTAVTIDNEKALQEEMAAAGTTFVEADFEAYTEATKPMYDEYEAWSEGLYEEVRAAIDEGK